MRMLFDGKACINGCTFCCSAICQGEFLNCHTIFMSISLSLLSLPTVTPLMKGQARNVLERNSKHKMAIFFIIFCWTFPYLLSKVPRSLSEFFSPLFSGSLTVQVTVMLRHGLDIASLRFSIVISAKDEYLWDWP